MEEKTIKVTLRQNSGSQFDIEISSKGTVRDLKEACVEKAGISADEQRLIFKGRRIRLRKDLHYRKNPKG